MDTGLKGLESDIVELCKKHKLTSASFTATASDGKGISLFSVDSQTIRGGCFEAALNVGRLWQHARTRIKMGLDNSKSGVVNKS